jgi:hypothetical protein
MWQSDIMEGMKYSISRCSDTAPDYKNAMTVVHNLMPTIPTFHFGDVEEVRNSKLNKSAPIFEQYPEYNRFPYPICMLEGNGFGDQCKEGEYRAKKRSIINSSVVVMLMVSMYLRVMRISVVYS